MEEQRLPLTQREKERIYQEKIAGKTLTEIAEELDCSWECVRKWWRVARRQGEVGLRAQRGARGSTGALSQFDPQVALEAKRLKSTHSGWGADRVLGELQKIESLQGLPLPSRSRLAAYFQESCPESVAARQPRPPQPGAPPPAQGVQQVWQLDIQEKILLLDGDIASVCSIRDPFAAAMIASQAFSVQKNTHYRKVQWTEIREVLRKGFTEWKTLPETVLTDNELVQAGGPKESFPSRLTLWLVGLGIRHAFIRPGVPTDQPQIERQHRILADWAQNDIDRGHLSDFQQALDRERAHYNYHFPTRSKGCALQPPVQAHPDLLVPRRPYTPEQELALFDLQRVFDFLARKTYRRKVHVVTAHISLGDEIYCLGRALKREHQLTEVEVKLDPQAHQWVVLAEDGQRELIRLTPKHLDAETLTGLQGSPPPLQQPVQLLLPFWLAS